MSLILHQDDFGCKLCPNCNKVLDLLRYANQPWPVAIVAACLNRFCTAYGQIQKYSQEEWHGDCGNSSLGRSIDYIIQLVRAGQRYIHPEITWKDFEALVIKELVRRANSANLRNTHETIHTEHEFRAMSEKTQILCLKCHADTFYGLGAKL